MSVDTKIEIGKVIKPHGLKGEVVFDAFVDSLSDFDNVSTLFYSDNSYKLEYIKPFKDRALLKLIGIDSIELAEELRSKVMFANEQDLPKDESAIYLRDLVGKLVYENDNYIGEVVGYYETAGTVLEVKLENGKQVDMPYAFVEKSEGEKLYVKLIEGIL